MRFILLREAGGIGDVVRTFSIARGLKERFPGARVEYVALAGYDALAELSPDIDRVHRVSERERRARDEPPDPARRAYLARIAGDGPSAGTFPPDTADPANIRAETQFIDLYCPAYRHEVETEGAVTLDRVELFCRAAEATLNRDAPAFAATERLRPGKQDGQDSGHRVVIPPSTPRLVVPAVAITRRSQSCKSCSSLLNAVIGLAPYATNLARSWLGRNRLVTLARALAGLGCRLVFFHSWTGPRPGRDEARAPDIDARAACRLPLPELAREVAACDFVIAADTGILHLAGAVGVPALGLFGPTSGEIICRPYPTHRWITGREAPARSSLPARCRPPCYCRRSRGYDPKVCGKSGCALLNRLAPEDVLEGACRLMAGG